MRTNNKTITIILILTIIILLATTTTALVTPKAQWKLENNYQDTQAFCNLALTGTGTFNSTNYKEGIYSYYDNPSSYFENLSCATTTGNFAHTVAGWVLINQTTSQTIFSMGTCCSNYQIRAIFINGDHIYVSNNGDDIDYTTTDIPLNTWTHITTVWYTNKTELIYFNGILNKSGQHTQNLAITGTRIGIGARAGQHDWDGKNQFDDIRYYEEALNASEILQLYQSYGIQVTTDLYITAKDEWNGTSLTQFSANITWSNGTTTTHSSTSGNIYLSNLTNGNTTYNITFWNATNYIESTNRTITLTNATSNTLTGYLHQAEIQVQAREINTNNTITNFTIQTEKGNYTTTIGTVYINTTKANYTWNFTNTAGYFNVITLAFEVNQTYRNYTISNIYARNLTFINNQTNTTITPNCTQGAYNYTTLYLMPKNNTNITCTLFGFINITFTPNTTTPDNGTYRLQPVQLLITFTNGTTGYITWSQTINGTDGYNFTNVTTIVLLQSGIGIGTVSIVFNEGQQLYQYYNDQNTHIVQTLHVNTPNLIQPIKLWDGAQLIQGRITAYILLGNVFVPIYSTFTNTQGYAQILLQDGNVFKFVGQADGYESGTTIQYIPSTSATTATDILYVTLTKVQSNDTETTITNSCPNRVLNATYCTITAANAHDVLSETFTFYVYAAANTTYTYNDTTSATITILVNSTNVDSNGRIRVDIYRDSTFEATTTINYKDVTTGEQVAFKETDESFIQQHIVYYIIMAIIGAVIVGFFLDKLGKTMKPAKENWGINGAMLFITLAGLYAPVLWAISITFFLWEIYDAYKNGI